MILSTLGIGTLLAWRFDMVMTVKTRGIIEPRRTEAVRPMVQGVIRRMYVRHGQKVNERDTLFCLYDARMGTNRERSAMDTETAGIELARLNILAPMSGTILTPDPETREGSRADAGETILEIGTLGDWVARVLVREEDIPKVRVGSSARLHIRAFPHMEYGVFEGKVEEISVVPVISPVSPTIVSYPLKVGIEHPEVSGEWDACSLRTGMSAEVSIAVSHGRIIDLLWRKLLGSTGRRW